MNFTVYVPKVDEHFVGSLAVIPLQLLGYYVSVAKGLDVDKPRNLAKSVTDGVKNTCTRLIYLQICDILKCE